MSLSHIETRELLTGLNELIQAGDLDGTRLYLAGLNEEEGSVVSPTAVMWFRRLVRSRLADLDELKTEARKSKCALLATLATASLDQIESLSFEFAYLDKADLDFLCDLKPPCLAGLGEVLLGQSSRWWSEVRYLVRASACPKPAGPAYVRALIASVEPGELKGLCLAEPDLLEEDLWKLFSRETCDPGLKLPRAWVPVMIELCREGLLAREPLLAACLSALALPITCLQASFYVRLHDGLEPSSRERLDRLCSYAGLTGGACPAAVSFAIKNLDLMDRQEALNGEALLESLESIVVPLPATAVKTASRLLERISRRDPGLSSRAAAMISSLC
ncbi:MAG: hypothetical protein IPM23_22550 [Candidatus Melainabacteria bacterium]|nr:hypothetical protein [Candidatus Melainabacteria bacterium]